MTGNAFSRRFIKARRDVIALDFMHLNDIQRSAVMTTEGPLLLLAGAGSGKTTILINRIANIIKYGCGADSEYVPEWATVEDLVFLEEYAKNPLAENSERAVSLCAVEPVEPWRLIAITFTNKAADELKDRLQSKLGDRANDIWAMTFHSACVRILRRDIDRLGFNRSFTIYDSADSQTLMKRILKELELDDKTFPYRSVLNTISRAKGEMLSAQAYYEAAERSGDIRKKHMGRAYIEYSNRLKSANALDFDDLMLYTVELLNKHEDILSYYQRKFKYVLIDEYQDTNKLQYLFSSALAGGRNNICVVGDDDQSIYKFRGATIENILSFESQYKKARVIRLEQNYRSTSRILDAANSVICNNSGRKGKKLWTEKEFGDKLTHHIALDERDEAHYVARQIISGVASGDNWSDFAVLYRMNAQSNQLEHIFKRSGIPYRVIGGIRFFERAEIKDMLAYLCVIANPDDDLRLMRIINTPPRGIGQVTLGHIEELASAWGKSAFQISRESETHEDLLRSAAKLHQFVNMLEELRELSETLPLDELYDELIERTGYIRALEAKATDNSMTRIENVQELKSNIIGFMKETKGASLADFLNEIALYTDIEQYDKSSDCVVMMTMHTAKGLEFPTVFIIGAEEGIFPSLKSIGESAEMEEERRLCYVAMTRAKNKLYFTSARQRMLFGKTTAGKPSRFVEEVSEDLIEKSGEVFCGNDYSFDEGDLEDRLEGARRVQNRTVVPGSGMKRTGKNKISAVPSKPVSAAPVKHFKKGDLIQHKAFGRGLVTDAQAVGGDALLEVAFDTVGTKRLMAKSASAYMQKVD